MFILYLNFFTDVSFGDKFVLFASKFSHSYLSINLIYKRINRLVESKWLRWNYNFSRSVKTRRFTASHPRVSNIRYTKDLKTPDFLLSQLLQDLRARSHTRKYCKYNFEEKSMYCLPLVFGASSFPSPTC